MDGFALLMALTSEGKFSDFGSASFYSGSAAHT